MYFYKFSLFYIKLSVSNLRFYLIYMRLFFFLENLSRELSWVIPNDGDGDISTGRDENYWTHSTTHIVGHLVILVIYNFFESHLKNRENKLFSVIKQWQASDRIACIEAQFNEQIFEQLDRVLYPYPNSTATTICIIGILDNESNKVDFAITLYSMCKTPSDWFII